MGNRVDELESQVSELQAAVDGLTEELVETRARLETLESHLEVDELESAGAQPGAARGPESVEGANTEAAKGQASEESPADETEADADAESESESDSDSGSGAGDDIIVA
jgi:uncharacterized coiled-coil protein SlyX